jgi:hypothetical protein
VSVALDGVIRHHPKAELGPVGWIAGEEMAYTEWLHQGSRLGLAGRSAGWWVGDWVRYGSARYGSKYAAAARVTGYDRQTLMNMVYVATRFEISRRREKLSWSHHSELAALEVDGQERWLNRALAERMNVRDLRDALTAAEQPLGGSSPRRRAARSKRAGGALEHVAMESHDLKHASSADSEAERAVVCPHCGHPFVP